MTSTSVKVIWADFGSIFTRLTRNLLIFNPCAQDETRTHTILRPLPPQSSVIWAHTQNEQKKRAENETRTRDPDLGKVVLYQLSYFRILF